VASTFGLLSSGTGASQAFNALGGTSSLVSVEALQEFRVETSSFAPEFGRSPGGQVLLSTRSGANDFHGGIYEYFRNDVLDANDWFANQAVQPRAAERHNDFGGFGGGPVRRDRTFFFVSYEGARLRQPNTVIVPVPSAYARSIASSNIAPFLNGYPQPDDRTVTPGVYVANFTGNFSAPSTLNAGSVRIDHTFNKRFSIFGRYNEALRKQSPAPTRSMNGPQPKWNENRDGCRHHGANLPDLERASRQLLGSTASQVSTLDSFGGAVPPSPSISFPALEH